MSSSKKGKMKKKSTRRPALRLEGSEPPPFELNVIYSKKMRYVASSALAVDNLTYTGIRSFLVVGNGAGATTATVLFANSVRVKKVEMWGPMVAALTPVTVSCQFPSSAQAGAAGSPPRTHSDTSMGMRAAHIKVHPPKDSLQADWVANIANADPFMILSGPINTVVDITYEFVPNWNLPAGAPPAGANTTANNQSGEMYWRTIDASGFLVPVVGVNNI